MLDDFSALLAALYAEETDTAIKFRQSSKVSRKRPTVPTTKLDALKSLWDELLPHRELTILHGNLEVKSKDNPSPQYSASELSDGERVIFYMLGQSLIARPGTTIIIDEPELHLNRSLIARLWDEIESARQDCAFIYMTHDIDFTSSRRSANKYFVKGMSYSPNLIWDIEKIPDNTGIPEDILTRVVGSRRSIIFVEGDDASLDASLYRRIYSNFTVIPVGGCDQVIHSVTSFHRHPQLHHVGCAGIVDLDHRNNAEISQLEKIGIYTTPVCEVENLLLIPSVFRELAAALHFSGADIDDRMNAMQTFIFTDAASQIDAFSMRYVKRIIDSELKKIDIKSKSVSSFSAEFSSKISTIDPISIYNGINARMQNLIGAKKFDEILKIYDRKGLLSEAARILGVAGRRELEEFIGRVISGNTHPPLLAEISKVIPKIAA